MRVRLVASVRLMENKQLQEAVTSPGLRGYRLTERAGRMGGERTALEKSPYFTVRVL
jgi:hypothetical protein